MVTIFIQVAIHLPIYLDHLAAPASVKFKDMTNDLLQIESVRKVHSLHVWCLTMDKFALTVHLVTSKIDQQLSSLLFVHFNPLKLASSFISQAHEADTSKVLRLANEMLRSKYNIDRTTIQIEEHDHLMDSCNQCQLPAV